jgi:hypothetical protein
MTKLLTTTALLLGLCGAAVAADKVIGSLLKLRGEVSGTSVVIVEPPTAGGDTTTDPYMSQYDLRLRFKFTNIVSQALTPDSSAWATNHGDYRAGLSEEPLHTTMTGGTNMCFDFDGADDRVLLNSTRLVGWSSNTVGTISFWARLENIEDYDTMFDVAKYASAESRMYCWYYDSTPSVRYWNVVLRKDSTTLWQLSSTNLNMNEVYNNVYFFAVSHDGTMPHLWQGRPSAAGVQEITTVTNTSTTLSAWLKAICVDATTKADSLTIGNLVGATTAWNGKICDFRISTNYTTTYITNVYYSTDPADYKWTSSP